MQKPYVKLLYSIIAVIFLGLASLFFNLRCNKAKYVQNIQLANSWFDVMPAGDALAFTFQGIGGAGIAKLDIKTGARNILVDTDSYDSYPRVSLDGLRMAYASSKGLESSEIKLLDLVSGKTIGVVSIPGQYCSLPAFVNNDVIVFSSSKRLRPYSMGGEIRDQYAIYCYSILEKNLYSITGHVYRNVIDFAVGVNDSILAVVQMPDAKRELISIDIPSKKISAILSDCYGVAGSSASASVIGVTRKEIYEYDMFTVSAGGSTTRATTFGDVARIRADKNGTLWFIRGRGNSGSFGFWKSNGGVEKVADGSP